MQEVRRWLLTCLQQGPYPDDAQADTQLLLQQATGQSLTHILSSPHTRITPTAWEQLQRQLQARLAHQPMAYILGHQDFMGLTFQVSDAVLIPRPETELLVEAVLHTFDATPRSILDIGTGCGCIAIALKHARPEWIVNAWDISLAALEIARRNAGALNAAVQFAHRDILNASAGPEVFDVIVSNPPYIAVDEAASLQPSVTQFEPHVALFAHSGLEFYQAIVAFAEKALATGGRLFFEIGAGQGRAVQNILEQHAYHSVRVLKDYSDFDRIVTAVKNQ